MKTGALIIPTGIGASIGGYAGDASKWARKLAKKCKLIVNPNVVNAACFSGISENMLYVEGYTMSEFFKGNCSLIPSENNRIGVVFDKAIPQDILNIHINTINAVKTVYDIDIVGYEITKKNVGVNYFLDSSGASVGNIECIDTIKHASCKLLSKGASAIAIVCLFPDDELNEDYKNGIGVDPVGGMEAIISHYISKELKIPTAHAPAFLDTSINSEIVNPKCAAEYITPTFLPCILLGLANAPLISDYRNGINVDDIDFLVVPYNALGGIPILEMSKRKKKIYAIKENSTILRVDILKFPLQCDIINTYEELLELI